MIRDGDRGLIDVWLTVRAVVLSEGSELVGDRHVVGQEDGRT